MSTSVTASTPTPDVSSVLTRIHAGLSARRTPQSVAADLVLLGAGEWLSAPAAAQLDELAAAGSGDGSQLDELAAYAAGVSQMASRYARHAGLTRPYSSAQTAMDALAAAAGVPRLEPADPADPAALAAWVAGALTRLGMPAGARDVLSARGGRGTRLSQRRYPSYGEFDDGNFSYGCACEQCASRDELDATELDATELDATELDATELDATELDATEPDATEPDATELDGVQASLVGQAQPDQQDWDTYTVYRRPRGRRGDTSGHVDPKLALPAAARRAALPGVSVRCYRRAVRTVLHLQQRTEVLRAARDREAAVEFGKSRLATSLTLAELGRCVHASAFVGYYTARLGLRTVFTNGEQARPMDTLAEELLTVALKCECTVPFVLAQVLTRQKVLNRLSPSERGMLLGRYFEQMSAAARVLRASFDPNRDRTAMVVRRGDDSTSWNAASRAFNQARTGWLNLCAAMGLAHLVAASCPGKVPALVAADVAFWHVASDGSSHDDLAVWATLPLPWDVLLDGASCPAALVATVCAERGMDPAATGWTAAYRQDHLEVPQPAPELVHGVSVASPALAAVLRRAGVFSGQGGNPAVLASAGLRAF